MSWIALKMLVGDRAKFFGIVMGLTFAALLITQQGSIFCGLMLRTAGQITDITGADLWVMDRNVRYIDDVKPMIENNLYRVRGVEGVLWAVPLYKGQARVKLNTVDRDGGPTTVIEQVILLGLDDATLVGAPPPDRILVGSLNDLRKPDAIVISWERLQKLYPGEAWNEQKPLGVAFWERFLNREVEMNDRRAVIVGVCEATRTFQSNPVVYTTYTRAKLYAPQERKILSYILAKTEDGLSPGEVAGRIERETGLGAKTSQEFRWMTIDYYLKYTGIPINFGITAVLGFIVGTAIAGQTFYNFTLENLKQFGSLKAMGATNFRIVKMILLQALVVGLLGYGVGVGAASVFGWKNQSPPSDLSFFVPRPLLVALGVSLPVYAPPEPPGAGLSGLLYGQALPRLNDAGPALVVTAAAAAVLGLLYALGLVKAAALRQVLTVLGLSYVLCLAAAVAFWFQGVEGTELAYYCPWQVLVITGCAVVLICVLASLISVRRVMVLEPAVVFRG